MPSIYKLIIATQFTTCKNFISLICFTVTDFDVIGFKIGLYSLLMALLCRKMLHKSKYTAIFCILYVHLGGNQKKFRIIYRSLFLSTCQGVRFTRP
jgi:hypothetical protein